LGERPCYPLSVLGLSAELPVGTPAQEILKDSRVANIKGQIKRNRQNQRRHVRNKAVRSELKTRVKAAQDAAASGAPDAADTMRLAQKRLDKAGAKGRIHKNAASRRTSRLMKAAVTKKPAKKAPAKKKKKATAKKASTAKKKAAAKKS